MNNKKQFPTQVRLHELLERKYDANGALVFVSKVDRGRVKKAQELRGSLYVCNEGLPSECHRRQLTIDGHAQNIAVFNYIFEYGNYDRKLYQVDHRDNDSLNDCHTNLQLFTRSQNTKKKRNSASIQSKYKGVCWDKNRKKWKATIKNLDGITSHIGLFESEKDAAIVWDVAAVDLGRSIFEINCVD